MSPLSWNSDICIICFLCIRVEWSWALSQFLKDCCLFWGASNENSLLIANFTASDKTSPVSFSWLSVAFLFMSHPVSMKADSSVQFALLPSTCCPSTTSSLWIVRPGSRVLKVHTKRMRTLWAANTSLAGPCGAWRPPALCPYTVLSEKCPEGVMMMRRTHQTLH